MSEFDIDKDIPIPKIRRSAKYPWHEMDIGDSFFIPNIVSKQITQLMSHQKTRNGLAFTARAVTENNVKGVRVWRIE